METVGDGLACCSPWGLKESDVTEQLNWTEWNSPVRWCWHARHDWSGPLEDKHKTSPVFRDTFPIEGKNLGSLGGARTNFSSRHTYIHTQPTWTRAERYYSLERDGSKNPLVHSGRMENPLLHRICQDLLLPVNGRRKNHLTLGKGREFSMAEDPVPIESRSLLPLQETQEIFCT